MKVVILCGGEGIRLKHQLEYIPKAMVRIDDKPMLWHVMKRYSLFGHNEFVLALGKNGQMIRDYFLNYNLNTNDIGFTINDPKKITYHNQSQEEDWKITLVNTGEAAHTGARLYRCGKYIDEDVFMLSYSDCLSDVNLEKLLDSHNSRKKIATVSGVLPPFRYGEFVLKSGKITDFSPTSKLTSIRGYVNGGFAIFSKRIFKYLNSYNECTLENEVYKKLVKENELNLYTHKGFWQCLDNDREFEYLKKLSEENKRYWLQKN